MACNCTHPHVKGAFIKRHDDVVRALAKEIDKVNGINSHPDHRGYMIMDAKEDKGNETEGGIPKRIPAWMLPNVEESIRLKMRPDIIHISGIEGEPEGEDMEEVKARAAIRIIEVGFTMDHNYEEKKREKDMQHSILMEELHKEGWNIKWQKCFIVGVGGVMYKDNRKMLEEDIGLEAEEVDRVMKKIQRIAVNGTQQAIRTRRHIEHGAPGGTEHGKGVGPPKVRIQYKGSNWDRG
jgi:hypothetical protein